MNPPFTVADFLAVFAAYNAAIWPVQIAAYALGLLAVAAIVIPRSGLMRSAFAALSVLWAFTGIGYHLLFFASINPLASLFAAFFVLQAILLLASAIRPGDLHLQFGQDVRSTAGLITLVYALAIYPVLGILAGHGGTAGPMFGVAPCPTTIFTIGLLLFARGRWVIWLSVIPIMWSLIGLAAAIQLGIWEDLAMPVTAIGLGGALALPLWTRRAVS
ncbi:DUF6064 family protein [Tabrizicola sp.]|uniref:DUF6064 family protein n=1 Tax=Tabrizicola sp. TaxID=2005166 RepID=UPI00286A9B87|nr:DUF6064 family protein [Tabrizicola sp.]